MSEIEQILLFPFYKWRNWLKEGMRHIHTHMHNANKHTHTHAHNNPIILSSQQWDMDIAQDVGLLFRVSNRLIFSLLEPPPQSVRQRV